MKAEILEKSGYCYGVANAINMAINIKSKHANDNVYVLGMLVHNEYVCDYLTEHGIKTINVEPSRYFEELQKLKSGDVVIFTAHGHDCHLDELAKELGLITYDTICPMVKKNNELIKKNLAENRTVIYIGQEGHPEAVGALSISKDIKLIPNKLLNKHYINTNKQLFVINQTTLNYDSLLETHAQIKSNFPNAIIANEVCPATRLRQKSILELDKSYDALIVVGSTKSSNTNKLYEIARNQYPSLTLLRIQGKEDIDLSILKGKKKVAITGGTSTPIDILQRICDYLNNLN